MPTVGEVYNPLIEAARTDNPQAVQMLRAVGVEIFKANPDKCKDAEDGFAAAKINLDYYCQYLDEETANKTKAVYGLGSGFRDLMGNKHGFV